MRLLLVDDDAAFRTLLRATFELAHIEVEEAAGAVEARRAVDRARPDAIVLDRGLPDIDGLAFCRALKRDRRTRSIPVVVLTGDDDERAARDAGADAFLRKPFRPLALLAAVESLARGGAVLPAAPAEAPGELPREPDQLLLYARDLRQLLEIERAQRAVVERAYAETVNALARALDSKDSGTSAHSQRVQRYALELARTVSPACAESRSAQYGFLLHDVGKIGIPDRILRKRGPLTGPERRLMRTHTVLGEQMLAGVAILAGEGLRIVRSHHERWDGGGYPDGLAGDAIPLGARIFAVADALDAMTSDRPYRSAMSWEVAEAEIAGEAGRQFDPAVAAAFREGVRRLRAVREALDDGVRASA